MVSLTDAGVGKRPDPGSGQIALEEAKIDDRTVEISVAGELDLATAPTLKWSLLDALKAGRNRLLINLSNVHSSQTDSRRVNQLAMLRLHRLCPRRSDFARMLRSRYQRERTTKKNLCGCKW